MKYREPVDETVIYYGYRKSEEAQKEIIFLANMEGQPRQVTPAQFDFPVNDLSEWEMVLSTPSVRVRKIDQPLRLSISQGVLRSEEHTSELQSRGHLVCRLLLEKKK